MAMAIFDATEDKEWLAQAGLELRGVCSSQEGPRLAQFVFFLCHPVYLCFKILAPAKAQHCMIL